MKYLRIKKKKEFARILKNGKRVHAETLTLVYCADREKKMAVCVGKKYGKSVVRNRIKRLLREAYRTQAETLLPCAVLLIPRQQKEYCFAAFSKDLARLFKKEKLIETRTEEDTSAKFEIPQKDGV